MSGYVPLSPILMGSEDGKRIYWRCPGCKSVHGIVVDGPERWMYNADPDKPAFTPSVKVTHPTPDGEHVCHSFVAEGFMRFLEDCTHELVNQRVAIPLWHMQETPDVTAP